MITLYLISDENPDVRIKIIESSSMEIIENMKTELENILIDLVFLNLIIE